MHNLKDKKFGQHSHTMDRVCANLRISITSGFCASVWRMIAHFWRFLAYFGAFANFATIKNFSQNLSEGIVFVLDITVVPNLTFVGFLSPGI